MGLGMLLIYSAGLRIEEACSLVPEDVNTTRD
jgi:site-specific recombinase XerD